ncbi:MAG: helix-turn-helix domain-containing protein [Pseudomonadota bacterium]|nr:helix-turn-helix domain-containing protein [Pseudomonadota bacterium]
MTLASSPLPQDRLAYSIAEVAALTGIGRTTLYKLMDRGALQTCKIGRRRLIPAHALLRLVSPDEPPPQ